MRKFYFLMVALGLLSAVGCAVDTSVLTSGTAGPAKCCCCCPCGCKGSCCGNKGTCGVKPGVAPKVGAVKVTK